MKETAKRKPLDGAQQVQRVREICLALPETMEKLSHGEPTFFVKKKVFAMCSINHHHDGHIAVVCPAPIGVQQALIESSPKKYYRPPYVGGAGWVGIELPRVSDKELTLHICEAWRLIAPPRLQATLPATPSKGSPQRQRTQRWRRELIRRKPCNAKTNSFPT